MEVILNIKNVSKVFNPKDGDLIIYNGKNWYITTKEDVLQDAYKLVDKAEEKIADLEKENAAFKKDIAKQMVQLSELIKQLYEQN